jgi:hypothetical protein
MFFMNKNTLKTAKEGDINSILYVLFEFATASAENIFLLLQSSHSLLFVSYLC